MIVTNVVSATLALRKNEEEILKHGEFLFCFCFLPLNIYFLIIYISIIIITVESTVICFHETASSNINCGSN